MKSMFLDRGGRDGAPGKKRGRFLAWLAGALFCGGILPVLGAAPSADKGKILTHCNGRNEGQTIYGARGCAVRHKVPDPEKTWFATEIRIHGEAYGAIRAKETLFYISFIDMDGNVYGTSEHLVGEYFSEAPAWARVKITPVRLPAAFYIVVDFKPSQEKGVYIGYMKEGGHSKLCDAEFNLYDIDEGVDFCIEVKVFGEVKGKFVDYDPSTFTKKADTDKKALAGVKKEETDLVSVEYTGLDEIWGRAVMTLCDTALKKYGEMFGLESETPVKVSVLVDPAAEVSGVRTKQRGLLEWTVKARDELLPRSRGGRHTHVYTFCRELARELVRQRLTRAEYAPEGLVDGFAAYLAGRGVFHVYQACGRELWPVPFNYQMEEGPLLVESWIEEAPEAPERRYASVLKRLQSEVGDERLAGMVKEIFGRKIPARDAVKALRAIAGKVDGIEGLDDIFPAGMVNPPMVWSMPKPDFTDYTVFEGLEARRYKSQVYLCYDDGSCENAQMLEEEEHALYIAPPPGTWRIGELKVYCTRKGGKEDGRILVKLRDAGLEVLGSHEVPYDAVDPKRTRWQSFGALPGIEVTAPFYLALFTSSSGDNGIEVGLDEGGVKSHSARIMPGSHIAALPEGGDWMVRIYLDPVSPMDREALDEAIVALRGKLQDAKEGR